MQSFRPKLRAAGTLFAATILIVGCSSATGRASKPAPTTVRVPPVQVTSSVTNGATGVALSAPIGVSVKDGTLKAVTLALADTSKGLPSPGEGVMNAQRTGWLSPSGFVPNTNYQLAAQVTNTAGKVSNQSWKFTTGLPAQELHTTTNVGEGSTYGVGMPIVVTLNTPIPAALHKAVTDRMVVTSTPAVTGAWRWTSDTVVRYRPSVYWPAHANVSLKIDFTNFDVGNGVWGVDGRTVNFLIGDSHISLVDATAHQMTVAVNGATVRTMPVSTGSAQYPTHSGIHVVNEKSPSVVMDSATVGIPRNSPDGYLETVLWDVRISNSGEFVHSAPWSVGDQGNSNVSHGCVNAAPADAEWFFNFSQIGDVVQVINTPLALQPDNGYGDWQIPWEQWAN